MTNYIEFIAEDDWKEKPKFKTRNRKKTSQEFQIEYNLKQITWQILRITEAEPLNENPGRIVIPSQVISETINQQAILQILNSNNPLENYNPMSGDLFQIHEEFIFEPIKNVKRNSSTKYLSFVFENEQWKPELFLGSGKMEMVKQGRVKIKNGS